MEEMAFTIKMDTTATVCFLVEYNDNEKAYSAGIHGECH